MSRKNEGRETKMRDATTTYNVDTLDNVGVAVCFDNCKMAYIG